MTVIDMSQIEVSSAGSHAKFTSSPEVVQLIGAGLNSTGAFDANATPMMLELLA